MGFLTGKTVIVTGGGRAVLSDGRCGSIGYGIATAYAKEGANVVITGRNVKKLEDAKEELGAVSEIKEDSADVSYENQNKLYVVSVDGTFDKRDAVVTVTFDKKGNLSSVAFNGVYTLGEKMSKAALNTVMGLAVVFIMLIFISLIIYCFKFIHEAEERAAAKKKASEPAPAPAPAPVVEETVEEEDDLELVAVIAAAIAASEGTDPNGLVVRSIKRVGKTNNWKRA